MPCAFDGVFANEESALSGFELLLRTSVDGFPGSSPEVVLVGAERGIAGAEEFFGKVERVE